MIDYYRTNTWVAEYWLSEWVTCNDIAWNETKRHDTTGINPCSSVASNNQKMEMYLKFKVISVNAQIQGHLSEWAAFCRKVCRKFVEKGRLLPFLLLQCILHDISMFNQTSQDYLIMNLFVHMLRHWDTLWTNFVDGSSWCVSTPKCPQFIVMSLNYLRYDTPGWNVQ